MKVFTSIKARQLIAPVPIQDLEEGDYAIWCVDDERAHMIYRLPNTACFGAWLTTDVNKADKIGTSGTYWWWNGDMECPTVRPSLGVPATPPYQWHGFLTNGVFGGV